LKHLVAKGRSCLAGDDLHVVPMCKYITICESWTISMYIILAAASLCYITVL